MHRVFVTEDEKREQIMADLTKVEGSCFLFTGSLADKYGKVWYVEVEDELR